MCKRIIVMTMILIIGAGVGGGVALLGENPQAQAAIALAGVLSGSTLIAILRRTGDIWKFDAPYQ
jgi:hypothetical protein